MTTMGGNNIGFGVQHPIANVPPLSATLSSEKVTTPPGHAGTGPAVMPPEVMTPLVTVS